jgi:hypothetical protein
MSHVTRSNEPMSFFITLGLSIGKVMPPTSPGWAKIDDELLGEGLERFWRWHGYIDNL